MTRKGNVNALKTGIKPSFYRRLAFEAYGEFCQRCGSCEDILVHHRDEDRYNYSIENLEVLCKTCHMKHHHGLNGRWAKSWDCCQSCGTTEREHVAKGLCNRCRIRQRNYVLTQPAT